MESQSEVIISSVVLAKEEIERALNKSRLAILPPLDAKQSLNLVKDLSVTPKTIILDPWYNKGFGGIRPDYHEFILELLSISATIADHVFLWGFPEIIAYFVDKLPTTLTLVAWLTWY